MADCICQLIENPELRQSVGAKAKENIIRFSRDNVMSQWTNLFNELTTHQ